MSVDRHPGSILRTALAFFAAASWPILAHAGTFTTLYAFSGPDGIYPTGVTGDANGNLYGATTYGSGTATEGTVFVLGPSGTLTTLLDFPHGSSGVNPGNQLTLRGTRLFGATPTGGNKSANVGSVYSLGVAGGMIRTNATLNGTEGANPSIATLRLDRTGNIFGATQYGGPDFKRRTIDGDGTLFELTPQGVLTGTTCFQWHRWPGAERNRAGRDDTVRHHL